jgi:hypothetical protein
LDRLPALDAAVSAGAVNAEQAAVIVHAVGELPDRLPAGAVGELPDRLPAGVTADAVGQLPADVAAGAVGQLPGRLPADVVAEATASLVGFAAELEPAALRRVGERILTLVAPDIAEQAEAEALERAEARAQAGRGLTFTAVGSSRVRLTGWLDTEAAATVNATLDPLCRPVSHDDRTPTQRRADALIEVCELALRTSTLPDNGGDRPQVVVTIGYDQLREQTGTAVLDTGERLSAAEARRICCDAQLLPAVLGTAGEVLDLGRSRRLITGPLRRALVLRDRGCSFPGCDRPARWCDGHHIVSWLDGGPTSLNNSALLCRHHHRVIHRGEWHARLAPDGRPEFVPPSYVDPKQKPRRNHYHRRP